MTAEELKLMQKLISLVAATQRNSNKSTSTVTKSKKADVEYPDEPKEPTKPYSNTEQVVANVLGEGFNAAGNVVKDYNSILGDALAAVSRKFEPNELDPTANPLSLMPILSGAYKARGAVEDNVLKGAGNISKAIGAGISARDTTRMIQNGDIKSASEMEQVRKASQGPLKN